MLVYFSFKKPEKYHFYYTFNLNIDSDYTLWNPMFTSFGRRQARLQDLLLSQSVSFQ